MIGEGGDTMISSPGRSPKQPLLGSEYMIPYMVGKLAPNSSHLTRGLVKFVPGRGNFRAVSYQKRDNFFTSLPPPQSLNWSAGLFEANVRGEKWQIDAKYESSLEHPPSGLAPSRARLALH